MNFPVVALWSLAVFLASAFAACIVASTLKPKHQGKNLFLLWLGAGIVGYLATFTSYALNLYNDFVGILGLSAFLCGVVHLSFEGSKSEKLFVSIMAALIANVVTFMFCGTTDTYLGAALGLFATGTPYNVPNLFLFIGIKVVFYALFYFLYVRFFRRIILHTLEMAEGQMQTYLPAPIISVIGFYIINYVTNQVGIIPTNTWFFPLYATLCIIFVVEFTQIINSVRASAEARRSEKEKQRISAELNVATQIQADMLPRIFPAFPDRKEFDIYATMDPAKEVGGDFYDFFLIDHDHLGMVMADVSGKGVPAALFMVIAKTLIKNRSQMGGGPAAILRDVNDQLCEGNEAELFVTVWFAILEISTGKGMAANAGHEHPALKRANGAYELVIYPHSPALATMEGMRFREHSFELHPGDTLFVYTDGVPEATNAGNELYGSERMVEALNQNLQANPQETLKTVRESIDAFVGDAPQFDDITMLCLHYTGMGGTADD